MAGSAPDGESVIQAGARDVGLDEFMAAYQESATSAESSRRDVDFPGAERALELDLTTSDGERSIALVADSGAGTTVFWAYQAPELDPAVVDYLRAGNIGFGTPPAPGFTRLRQTSAAVGAGFDALLADVPEGFALDGFQAGTSVTYRRGAVDSGPADGEVVELRILGGTGSGVSELPEAVDLLLQELARNGAEDVTPQPGQVAGADDAVLLRSEEVEGPEGAAFSQWTVLVQAPSGAIFLMRYAAPVGDFDEGLAAELVDSLQIESS